MKENQEKKETSKPHLIFPGGGIFFYWQAGAVTYLREQKYDLSNVEFTGGSAGALTATLAATDVNYELATESALQMAQDAGVWDRPLGLYGIWGPLIETWLDELLPENSLEMVADQRLSILLTEFPTLKKNKISDFESKHDLIQCNMASVHLPMFLNGNLYTDYRSSPHIDGSFFSQATDYISEKPYRKNIVIDWTKDEKMTGKSLKDSVTALSRDGIWDLLEQGRTFAQKMEKQGKFEYLSNL